MTAGPARRALEAATEANDRLGHENLGFLSAARGFMPREHPLLELPASHRAWDSAAVRLPELFRTLALRGVLERMPVLGAAADELDERFLLRASAILGIFAHSYFYVEPNPPESFPDSVVRPWKEVSRRLRQPARHLSFTDLNLYNWKVIDPLRPDFIEVENLQLLIPILGNVDERRFQMTPVEMVSEFTPVVGAVVRAQEAVLDDDVRALQDELVLITDVLRRLSFHSFMKVDPNAHSRSYVNPVVWGKTVAPLATPFQSVDPPPGPSGTAIPAFQLLDGFLGRRRYASSVGQETARVRAWFPPHWRDFLDACEQVSIPEYVARRGRRELQGLFDSTLEAYAGDTGLLGRHRLKTFGFLDLSFKAGRSKTLGGFGGGFDDRLWDRMDGELELSRRERYPTVRQGVQHGRVRRVEPVSDGGATWVGRIVLDLDGAGVRYRPGSRCAVLPENGRHLVERTLRALHATGEEPVELTQEWREAVAVRAGFEDARVVSLRTLLTFGRIRPVGRRAAKALYRLSDDARLRRIIEARAEDQWELWQLLELLATHGFKPSRLWKARPGERDGIVSIVPPETFRMFSVASAMPEPAAEPARELTLLVGRLQYETSGSELSPAGVRFGTATSFLTSPDAGRESRRPVSIKLVEPPQFALPADPRRPVVMFAGGTGLSPFLGMLAARARGDEVGDNLLFLATRTKAELYCADELRALVATGKLDLRVAYSRDETSPRRIGDVMLGEETARQLWSLLRAEDDGGLGATFYVCGRTGFAGAVMAGLRAVIARFGGESHADRLLYKLIGERRCQQEIFTTYAGPQFEQPRTYAASDLVCHNSERDGYWMALDGRVYDVTGFAEMHPGGRKIIRSYAGMDATDAYRTAQHDANPEIDAMLGLYEIGVVRRLDFGAAWNIAVSPSGLRLVSLKDVYRAWIGLLYTAVEIQNAIGNDYDAADEPVTYDETVGDIRLSPYRLQMSLQTHDRFTAGHVASLTGARLEQLWTLTCGLGSAHHDVHAMRRAVGSVEEDSRSRPVPGQVLGQRLRTGTDDLTSLARSVAALEREDKRFVDAFKLALRTGVQVFERWQHENATHGGNELVAAATALPRALADYRNRLAAIIP